MEWKNHGEYFSDRKYIRSLTFNLDFLMLEFTFNIFDVGFSSILS